MHNLCPSAHKLDTINVYILFFLLNTLEGGTSEMPKKSKPTQKMTPKDARRVQSAADKSGKNQDFKARAMRSSARNKRQD